MKQPTQQQLKDSKWWDENDPTGGEATHFVLAGGGLVSAWRHLDDQGDWLSWRYDDGRDGEWVKIKGNDRYLINRPRSTQWKGPQDGLPPVGYTQDDCALNHLDESDKFTVVAHYHGHAIVVFGPGMKEGTVMSTAAKVDEFRPIQSERDRLIEAAMSNINQDWASQPLATISDYVISAVAQVYDAGMLVDPERKPMSRLEAQEILTGLMGRSNWPEVNKYLDALGYKE